MLQVQRDSTWDELDDVQRQMGRLLDHFTSCKRMPVRFSPCLWNPAVDVFHTDDEVVVVAELAGVKREDVKIALQNNTLLISGERRAERAGKARLYQIMEVSFGCFERCIELPALVNPDTAVAHIDSGFLIITMKKGDSESTLTQITIMTGDGAGER